MERILTEEDFERLESAKQEKISEIETYDSSENVNIFYFHNIPCWLDKVTRIGLTNAIEMLRLIGEEMIDVWMGSIKVSLPLNVAEQILAQVEVYALKCYNVTAQHKVNVNNLAIIEEVSDYDYTTDYPEKLYL